MAKTSSPGRILGAFAVVWGVQVALVRVAIVLGPSDLGRPYLLASQAFIFPLYLLLAQFVATYPEAIPATKRGWWLPVLALPGLAALAFILLDLDSGARGEGTTVWGWATAVLLFPPFVAAEVLGLTRFSRGYVRRRDEPARSQLFIASLALVPYLWHEMLVLGTQVSLQPEGFQARFGALGFAIYVACIVAGLVACGAASVAIARHAGGDERRLILATTALAAVTGVLPIFQFTADLRGFWRLFLVALLGYAVSKYQLFDLDLRLRKTAPKVAVAGVGFAAWGLLATVAGLAWEVVFPDDALAFVATGLLGAIVGAAAYRPITRFFDAQFPHIRSDEEYLLRRKFEVYRAAKAQGAEAADLDRLAEELALRTEERAVLDRARKDKPPDSFPERYRIERLLAHGAFGAVFLAWDQRVGERVVLKQYLGLAKSSAGQGFLREAKALGDLRHPNVIAVRDVFRAGGDAYIALEHAPDGSLADRLRARPALPLQEALVIAEQVLAGLAAAHKQDIVHRDLKPENVLFRRGEAKLADFGVALDPVLDRAVRAARWQPGTLAWMAPEQVRGEPATRASDVYATGALVYRMLAGTHYLPVEGQGERGLRKMVLGKAPALPLPGVPEEVNTLLAEALAKDPAARPPDAGAMLRKVERARRRAAREQGQTPQDPAQPFGSPAP